MYFWTQKRIINNVHKHETIFPFPVLHTLRRVFTNCSPGSCHHGHVLLLGIRGLPRGSVGLGHHANIGLAVSGWDFGSSFGLLHPLFANNSRKFALPISFGSKEESRGTHCKGKNHFAKIRIFINLNYKLMLQPNA